MDLRALFACGLMLLLFCAAPFPVTVFAQRSMQIQAAFNPTETDQGLTVTISGRVFEAGNISVPNAVISIQVINPQGTSILVSIRYTDSMGAFQDTFRAATNSPAGNYTAFLVVDKPGYDTARLTLTFTYASPDFSIEISAPSLSLRQGQNGSLSVTILSLRGFDERVNLTAINIPLGVALQFDPPALTPSGTVTVNVIVSDSALVGNYTVTFLAVSGALNHKAPIQINLSEGQRQADWTGVVVIGGATVFLLILVALGVRFRRGRKLREAILEELFEQASADTGYIATARVIARLEELRAFGKVDENTYQRLKREYEKRLEKSA
jgi:hypothetical protein